MWLWRRLLCCSVFGLQRVDTDKQSYAEKHACLLDLPEDWHTDKGMGQRNYLLSLLLFATLFVFHLQGRGTDIIKRNWKHIHLLLEGCSHPIQEG